MSASQILITNRTSGNLSLDLKFAEKRQLRASLAAGAGVDAAPYGTSEEINAEPTLQAMVALGYVVVTVVPGTDDVVPGVFPTGGGSGYAIKQPVVAASTANIATLATLLTIDTSVTLAEGDRILVKNQGGGATHINNGIYIASAGAWTRAGDFNQDDEAALGTIVVVTGGNTQGGTAWFLSTTGTVGTDALGFTAWAVQTLASAAPTTGVGGANAAGGAATIALSDHNHKLRTTTGPTDLAIAAVADLTVLQRSGTDVVGVIPVANMPVARYTLAADSTLAANVIGAATETIHTALTLTSANLATARRLVKFYARLRVTSSNAADTWTFKARLGGLAGTLLLTSAAINITNNDVYTFEGAFSVRTIGAGGTFDSVSEFVDVANGTAGVVPTEVLAGAVDTTGSNTLVITGECSSANAGNIVSLQHFSAEVWGA